MRRSLLTIIGVAVMCVALVRPHHAFAATNENFDSYATNTLAEDLTTPGVTYDGGGLWSVLPTTIASPLFITLTGQALFSNSIGTPLTIDFSQPQNSYDFIFALSNFDIPSDLDVEGRLNGGTVFTDTITAIPPIPGSWPEGNPTGSGIIFDQLIISSAHSVALDNLVTTDYVAPAAGINVPHVTDIRINSWEQVVPYDSPAGSPVKLANGATFALPQDYDGNGYDTYIVTDTAVVDGVTWYSIFLGNESFVWVNGSEVTLQ